MANKKSKAGRPKMKKGDKVQRIPIAVAVKHHKVIKQEFEPTIKSYVAQLDSTTPTIDKP